jgi:hypothetical protein
MAKVPFTVVNRGLYMSGSRTWIPAKKGLANDSEIVGGMGDELLRAL